ncbi:D-aminopeptidase [Microdochium nivale]|nr:D-aminopeptidase [Microdochium nivale]
MASSSSDATSAAPASPPPQRMRLRDLVPGLKLGDWAPGPLNSLTDVPGVKVHVQSLVDNDGGRGVNTGVTCILPRDNWFHSACHAGLFRFNGSGELTGSHWIEETGLLHSPIVLTNSFAVGAAYQGIYEYAIRKRNEAAEADGSSSSNSAAENHGIDWFLLPVVAETFDGYMNDLSEFAVTSAHVVRGLDSVSSAPVPEGNTGGGTGMLCSGHKGGTGSASRLVPGLDNTASAGAGATEKTYTVAALVQANYGRARNLRIAGYPVGRILAAELAERAAASAEVAQQQASLASHKDRKDGSIIVILATDAPLSPTQLQRLAKRATVGLARAGGQGHNPSGDIFLAFSTGNEIPVQTYSSTRKDLDPFKATALAGRMVDDTTINGLFEAAAEATEESIYNALCMAETMVGNQGRKVEALPLQRTKEILEQYMAVDARAQMTY